MAESLGVKASERVNDLIQKLSFEESVSIISAPWQKCTASMKMVAISNPWCFNPEVDFPDFGVLSEENSAGWLFCWRRIAEIAAQKGGTAFFMEHRRRGFEGGQQHGEWQISHDEHGQPIGDLRVFKVFYDESVEEALQRFIDILPRWQEFVKVTENITSRGSLGALGAKVVSSFGRQSMLDKMMQQRNSLWESLATPGVMCLLGGEDSIVLWDMSTSQTLQKIRSPSAIRCLAFHGIGCCISGSEDGKVRIWNLTTGECDMEFKGHRKCVTCIAALGEERYISGSLDGVVRVWNLSSKVCEKVLDERASPVHSVAVVRTYTDASASSTSPSGAWTKSIWDFRTGTCLAALCCADSSRSQELSIRKQCEEVLGTKCISGHEDKTLRVWNLCNGMLERVLDGHDSSVHSVVALNVQQCLSASNDKTVRVWNLKAGTCEKVLEHSDGLLCTECVDSSKFLAAASNGSLRFGDWIDGSYVQKQLDVDVTNMASFCMEKLELQLAAPSNEPFKEHWEFKQKSHQRCVLSCLDSTLRILSMSAADLEEEIEEQDVHSHIGKVCCVALCSPETAHSGRASQQEVLMESADAPCYTWRWAGLHAGASLNPLRWSKSGRVVNLIQELGDLNLQDAQRSIHIRTTGGGPFTGGYDWTFATVVDALAALTVALDEGGHLQQEWNQG